MERTGTLAHLYDPNSTGGGLSDHVFVRLRLGLLAILSELDVEGLVLALFDLHRTRSERTRDDSDRITRKGINQQLDDVGPASGKFRPVTACDRPWDVLQNKGGITPQRFRETR